MTSNCIFVAFALVSVVMAGPGPHEGHHGGPHGDPHGGHHGGPPFLANVSAEGKKAFEEVFRNENLTLAEISSQSAALAEKYGVSELYKEFEANRTAHLAEVKKNQTAVISSLSSVASQLSAIYQNKDQTRKAQHDAVEALRKDHRVEVDTIKFIRERLGAHGRHHGGEHRGAHEGFGKGHGKGDHGDKNGEHNGKRANGKKQ